MLDPVSLIVGYVGGVLTLLVVSWGMGRLTHDAAQTAAQAVYACRCGQRFHDEQTAKEHARDTHNAPLEDDEWLYLMD